MTKDNIIIKEVEESKFGGRLQAYHNNKVIGWLRYHIDFDDNTIITISCLEVLTEYKHFDIEEQLLSYITKKYSETKYIIKHDYKKPC